MIASGDMRPRVHRSDGGEWVFECPGCNCLHAFGKNHAFNGDTVRPTFLPALLIGAVTAGTVGIRRCHAHVTAGCIQFLADCTHALAGQTVDMEPWQR
jgi:hypothetical protein